MRTRIFGHSVVAVIAWGVFAPSVLAKKVLVREYVVETQEQRESTRFTLTEWLKIKERMKMMDLWLAMFSSPEKDRFSPEINVIYGQHQGTVNWDSNGEAGSGSLTGQYARGQLWLTNIISGTVGIRLLNIDLGGEGYMRMTGAPDGTPDSSLSYERTINSQYYAGNLRLFGKSIQDTSLVAKYGAYSVTNNIPFLADSPMKATYQGVVYGGELQLYLLKFLGMEGNYLAYQDTRGGVVGEPGADGTSWDGGVFIEISLLRLMAGKYEERWNLGTDTEKYSTIDSGYIFGVKLQL